MIDIWKIAWQRLEQSQSKLEHSKLDCNLETEFWGKIIKDRILKHFQ